MYTLKKMCRINTSNRKYHAQAKTELKQLKQIVSCGVGVNKKDK